MKLYIFFFFFFSSRRRHTRLQGDWSSDVCSSDLLAAGNGGRDPLVLETQVPPGLVVPRRRDLAREDLPAPLVDEETERQEGDLVEGHLHEEAEVAARRGILVEQADALEIGGRRPRLPHEDGPRQD